MWCVVEWDEEYIARMEELLGLYEKPLCVPLATPDTAMISAARSLKISILR